MYNNTHTTNVRKTELRDPTLRHCYLQDIVTALLSRGADPKAQDKNAYMPHHDAASRGRLRALDALLRDKRTPINEGVHEGLTALHLAASEDNHQVIEVLLAHAADVDKRSYVVSRHACL